MDSETDEDEGDIGGEDEIAAYCYLTGRYKDELLSLGRFDDAVCRAVIPGGEKAVRYMEQMPLRSGSYYDIYDCTQPILIYRGDDLCYRVLDLFAEKLGCALEDLGQRVEYYDVSGQEIGELANYANRRFKAVIGMQTNMFSVKWQEGYRKSGFVYDSMDTPKYHFVFDHPILVRDHLTQIPNRTCILTPDGNYSEFIRNYYGHRADFFLLRAVGHLLSG